MGIRKMQSIFTTNISLLIKFARSEGLEVTFGDAYRDPLLAKINSGKYDLINRATGDRITLARRGAENSLHRRRLALDLNLFKNGIYLSTTEAHRAMGRFWESLNVLNRWGGRFDDGNHYEMVPHYWRGDDYTVL